MNAYNRVIEDQLDAGLREPRDVREEMLEMGVQFEDAILAEKIKPVIDSALACRATCTVNPINTLIKIRTAFGGMVKHGEISADDSTMLTARMMASAGDESKSRQAVVDQFKAGDFSALKI